MAECLSREAYANVQNNSSKTYARCVQRGIFKDRFYYAVMSSPNELSDSDQFAFAAQVRELVCDALRRSHRLSKELSGFQRNQAFRNRADLASILIISGHARPNGVAADGKVGLDIVCDHPFRVHQYPNQLHPAARAWLAKQVPNLPAKSSIREQLEAKGRDAGFTELLLPGKTGETP